MKAPGQPDQMYGASAALPAELVECMGMESDHAPLVVGAQLAAVLDCLPFYVLLVDSNHVIHFANKPARDSLNKDLSELVGKECPSVVHGVDHYPGCPVTEAAKSGLREKTHYSSKDGTWLWTTAYPTGMKTADGCDIYFHMMRDVTKEMETREAAADSERKFHSLFEALEDAAFVMSPDGLIQDINHSGLELLQLPSLKAARRFNLQDDLEQIEGWDGFYEILHSDGRVVDREVTFKVGNGSPKMAVVTASFVADDSPDNGLIRVIMRDVTRNRELEALSITDALTALYNRRFFEARLDGLVRRAEADGSNDVSVIFLDIDDFKSYNDTFGHQEGDYVLQKVAESIRLALRDGDMAARYGGEEFAVILSCESSTAYEIGERIRSNVEEMCTSSADRLMKRSVTVSVGVGTLGPGMRTADRLVSLADSRMYEAKQSGKNSVCGPRTRR